MDSGRSSIRQGFQLRKAYPIGASVALGARFLSVQRIRPVWSVKKLRTPFVQAIGRAVTVYVAIFPLESFEPAV